MVGFYSSSNIDIFNDTSSDFNKVAKSLESSPIKELYKCNFTILLEIAFIYGGIHS